MFTELRIIYMPAIGGENMTLNLFFLTITVTRRPLTPEEVEHAQRLKEIEEEMMDRKYEFYRMF